jgi:DNA-binding NarL/FixJ family response regulator
MSSRHYKTREWGEERKTADRWQLPPAQFDLGRFECDGYEYAVLTFSIAKSVALEELGVTEAECAVAFLVLEGLSNVEISRRRGTSTRTVANQLASIYRKLGIGCRIELVRGLWGVKNLLLVARRTEEVYPGFTVNRYRILNEARKCHERRGSDRLRSERATQEEVGTIWLEVVAGHRSAVGEFETDGLRHIVVDRGIARTSPLATLGLRERQLLSYAAMGYSNKLIGYDLGISRSAVSHGLRRACSKLSLPSRDARRFFGRMPRKSACRSGLLSSGDSA